MKKKEIIGRILASACLAIYSFGVGMLLVSWMEDVRSVVVVSLAVFGTPFCVSFMIYNNSSTIFDEKLFKNDLLIGLFCTLFFIVFIELINDPFSNGLMASALLFGIVICRLVWK
jgi:hypothetical protein